MATVHPNKRSRCWWWEARDFSLKEDVRLSTLCLQTLTNFVGKVAEETGRNMRKKKALQEHFSYSLPISVQTRLLEEAAANMEDANILLNLLFMFQPFRKLPVQNVDLLGKMRYAINLEIAEQDLSTHRRWYPFYPFHPLTEEQLSSLYNTLSWSNGIETLEGISLAVEANALKTTNFPNILARAHSLTRVVILEGADNHTLRILGIHCPSLKHLDVSHSWLVNDAGLQGLLLKRSPQRQKSRFPHCVMLTSSLAGNVGANGSLASDHMLEKNACAASLEVFILTGTQVTWEGCDFACQCMPKSYLHAMRPIIKIARMKMKSCSFGNAGLLHQVYDAVWGLEESGVLPAPVDIDLYKPPPGKRGSDIQSVPEENPIAVVYACQPRRSFVCLALKLEGTQVTSLVLPFYSLQWEWPFPLIDIRLPLRTLADRFPNLVYFRGCLRGVWHEDPLISRQMIHLKKVNAWAICSTTVVSILRHCSSLTMLEYNHMNFGEDDQEDVDFDHEDHYKLCYTALLRCFIENPGLKESLEEITLRPALDLGPFSLNLFVEKCHNLRRIGDLHTWNLTQTDITRLTSKLLENGRVPPIFGLFNSPPSDQVAKEWDSWMIFD